MFHLRPFDVPFVAPAQEVLRRRCDQLGIEYRDPKRVEGHFGLRPQEVPQEAQALAVSRDIEFIRSRVDNDYRHSIENALTGLGYRNLGSGCFATVFGHPKFPKVAVKVGQGSYDSGSTMGDGFPLYVRWIVSQKTANPHALRVFNHFHLTDRHAGMYCTVVERLKEATPSARTSLSRAKQSHEGFDTHGGYPRRLKDLIAALAPLGNLDLHGGNVMTRPGTDVPVITDPLVLRDQ